MVGLSQIAVICYARGYQTIDVHRVERLCRAKKRNIYVLIDETKRVMNTDEETPENAVAARTGVAEDGAEAVQDSLFEPATAGEALRAAREAKGLSLEHVSAETRIPIRHLETIEGDHYE